MATWCAAASTTTSTSPGSNCSSCSPPTTTSGSRWPSTTGTSPPSRRRTSSSPTRAMCDRRPTSRRPSGRGSSAAGAGWPCTAPTARSTHRSAEAGGLYTAPRAFPRVGRHAGEPVPLAPADRAVPRQPVTGRRRGPARRRHRAVRVGRRAVPDGAPRRRRPPAGDALDGNHAVASPRPTGSRTSHGSCSTGARSGRARSCTSRSATAGATGT